jgi:hypothetical protein
MSKLLTGLFISCSGEWNNNSNSFHRYTDKETRNCCVNQYKPARDYCLEQCDKSNQEYIPNCKSICNNSYNLGIQTCKLISHSKDNDTHSNDTHSNGTHSNGTHSNGTHSNGTHSNDTHSNIFTKRTIILIILIISIVFGIGVIFLLKIK